MTSNRKKKRKIVIGKITTFSFSCINYTMSIKTRVLIFTLRRKIVNNNYILSYSYDSCNYCCIIIFYFLNKTFYNKFCWFNLNLLLEQLLLAHNIYLKRLLNTHLAKNQQLFKYSDFIIEVKTKFKLERNLILHAQPMIKLC